MDLSESRPGALSPRNSQMLYRRGELLRLAKPERSIAGILAKEFKLSVRQVQNILRDALGRY